VIHFGQRGAAAFDRLFGLQIPATLRSAAASSTRSDR
jgi:hypothetical protein